MYGFGDPLVLLAREIICPAISAAEMEEMLTSVLITSLYRHALFFLA